MTEQKQHNTEKQHNPTKEHVALPENAPRAPRIVAWIGLGLVLFILAFGGGALGAWLVAHDQDTVTTIDRSAQNDGNKALSGTEQEIASVADKVGPSVVSITVEGKNSQATAISAGTGVILSKDGYIITNKHVVEGARSIHVATAAGDLYDKVSVVGSDPLNDVAYLKIDNVDNLIPAEIGESSTLRKGQNVIAIGNSLGQYDNTVTSGIVSGLGRPIAAESGSGDVSSLTDLIQTDAAINPGNSGGPLVNLKGQVVGINTAVASDAQGIGFAIPINATKGTMQSVLEEGKVKRAYFGVRYLEISPALAKEEKLPVKKGALIRGAQNSDAVVADGPAAKAGLKEGDIITKINDLTVGENGGVGSLVAEYKPGDVIKVSYLRDGKERTATVTLSEYTGSDQAVIRRAEPEEEQGGSSTNPFFPW